MRIVVVDPSRTILKAVSRLLEKDGHLVSAFTEGQDALDCIKSAPDVSVLMTSAELASMSGLELCWEARLLTGRDRALYIILMSSNAEQTHVVNALDSGADEFIRKPPAGEELYARLRTAERLLRQQRELMVLAYLDSLTGVLNRRAFFDKAGDLIDAGRHFAAVMFDIDHFKHVNDTHGHAVGDQVLRVIGREARGGNCVLGRLGGEEFAILLEGSSLQAATLYAEELRRQLADLSFEATGQKFSITASFGVAERAANESIDQLLTRADAALYQAKRTGRDRVVAAAEAGEQEAPWSKRLRSGRRSGGEPPPAAAAASNGGTVDEAQARPHDANNVSADAARVRAFVLDNELKIAAIVGKVLEAGGFSARTFTAMPQFFTELTREPPDLVVLDLSLGDSNAVEVICRLKASGYRGKVLLIGGRDETTLRDIAQVGAHHGLAMLPPLKKPFRPADVRHRYLSEQTVCAAEPNLPQPAGEVFWPGLAGLDYQAAS